MPGGLLYPQAQGALTDFGVDKQPRGLLGALQDPRAVGLLTMGLQMMQGAGPSPFPRSTGSILGGAGLGGLQAFGQAQQGQAERAMNQARMKLLGLQTQKLQGDVDLTRSLVDGGSLGQMNDPDKLEALGTRLAAGGHPGGASLIEQAGKMRQRRQERMTSDSFKSAPGMLGAGVTTDSPQGGYLLRNLTGDQGFDNAVLQAQNEALNSNSRLAPQPIKAPTPGLFEPLYSSPYVGPYAQNMQAQLNSTTGLSPQHWLAQADRLTNQHFSSTGAATARGENAALRRDIADQTDATRRMIAGMSHQGREDRSRERDEQRTFTRERSLANDFNRISGDFRTVLPAFQSTAQYIAGQKYDSSGDRALAFSFARTLDPKDRVGVRDIADINRLGNLPERFTQALAALAQGKQLPDRVRLEMFDVMRRNFENMNEQQQQYEDEYETRARSYMIRPENVVQRHAIRRERAPGAAPGRRNTSGGWSATEVPAGR